jgi:hypothetical protein
VFLIFEVEFASILAEWMCDSQKEEKWTNNVNLCALFWHLMHYLHLNFHFFFIPQSRLSQFWIPNSLEFTSFFFFWKIEAK